MSHSTVTYLVKMEYGWNLWLKHSLPDFFIATLYLQRRSFLILNFQFNAKILFCEIKKSQKKAFFLTNSHHHFRKKILISGPYSIFIRQIMAEFLINFMLNYKLIFQKNSSLFICSNGCAEQLPSNVCSTWDV